MFGWLKKFSPPAMKTETATPRNDPWLAAVGETLDVADYDPTLRYKASGIGVKKYDDVAQDSRCGALLDVRKSGVLRNNFEIIPGGDKRGDKRAYEACKVWAAHCDMQELASALLDSTLYGYAVTELVWGANAWRSGLWLPLTARAKPPARFVFTPEFDLRLLTAAAPMHGEATREGKFLVCQRNPKNDNPFGEALGLSLWWLVWFRKNGLAFFARHVDRFGSPWAIAKYPAAADDGDKRKVRTMLARIRRDTGIMIPETFALELMNVGGGGAQDLHERWVRFINEEISLRITGAVMTSSANRSSGSRAGDEVEERVAEGVVMEDARRLERVFNEQLFRWITIANVGDGAMPPRLRIEMPNVAAQTARAARDEKLRALGFAPKEAAAYAAKHYAMEIDEEFYARHLAAGNETSPAAEAELADEDELAMRKSAARAQIRAVLSAADDLAGGAWAELEQQALAAVDAADDAAAFDAAIGDMLAAAVATGGGDVVAQKLHDGLMSAYVFGDDEEE